LASEVSGRLLPDVPELSRSATACVQVVTSKLYLLNFDIASAGLAGSLAETGLPPER
jgi:hypothetical protein